MSAARSATEAAFDALLGGVADDVLVLTDRRLRIERAGAAAAELAEREPGELEGMSLIAAFGSVSLDAIARQAVEEQRPARGEVQLGSLGKRIFLVEAIPSGVDGLLLFMHDVTAMRRIEQVRRDFIANISHELRTPLSSIKLIAETLSGGAVDDMTTARDFAGQVERELDHLTQLVDELLELSMIESGKVSLSLAALDPGEVVAAVAERMRPLADRRRVSIRLVTAEETDGPLRACGDLTRLSQALVNLVHNAIKFSHPGGEVRIGWEARQDSVRFEVTDDGIGIPATHLPRIFERFYKVDRSRTRDVGEETDLPRSGSTGLGLAIVRHIAEAQGGSVGAESVEGRGSRFWLETPRAAADGSGTPC